MASAAGVFLQRPGGQSQFATAVAGHRALARRGAPRPACRLILDGRSVTRAAELSGFGSDESLRRAFGRQLGTTPSEYRARFATTRSG